MKCESAVADFLGLCLAYEPDVPGFRRIAGDVLFAFGIADYEAVLVGVIRYPFSFGGADGALELATVPTDVGSRAQLVFAVPGLRAGAVRVLHPVKVHPVLVGGGLLIEAPIGAVR